MDYVNGKLYRVREGSKFGQPLTDHVCPGDVLILLSAVPHPTEESMITLEFIVGEGIRKVTDRILWVDDWLEGPL